jgi:hypothetical protein
MPGIEHAAQLLIVLYKRVAFKGRLYCLDRSEQRRSGNT